MRHRAGVGNQYPRVALLLEVVKYLVALPSGNLTVDHAHRPVLAQFFLQHVQGSCQWHEQDHLLASFFNHLLH